MNRTDGDKEGDVMQITIRYDSGRVEVFDSNSLTSAQPFGQHNLLTEFDVRFNELGTRSIFLDVHRYEDAGADETGEVTAEARRQRGRRFRLADKNEIGEIEFIELDGKLVAWSQAGTLVDATRFELAQKLYYSGDVNASYNHKAVCIFDYITNAFPDLAGNEAAICSIFGYTPAAFREAEFSESMQPKRKEKKKEEGA